jgi:hypothetical protein
MITQCLIFNFPNYPYQKTKTPQQQQIIKNSNSCSQIKSHFFNKKNHGPLKYNQTPLKLGPQKAQIKTKIQKPEKEINMKYDQTQKRKKNKKCNLSCPAVSQICAFTILSSTWMLRVANSTPMVDFDSKLNSFFVNRDKRLDLPTPESPIRTTLNR